MIIEEYKNHIDDFEVYLKDKLDGISCIEGDNALLYQKILYLSFFDSLSACIYPNVKSNKERFISLIDKFSTWKDGDRISTTHLGKMLALYHHPSFETIRKLVNDKLISWQNNKSSILISEDFTYADLVKHWQNQSKDYVTIPFKLEDFRHSNLLYGLRNTLVHQFQSEKSLLRKKHEPYYEVVQEMNFEDNKIELLRIDLVHPNIFLKNLCEETLTNCINYFRDNNLNPFPTYYAGDYLLNTLNN